MLNKHTPTQSLRLYFLQRSKSRYMYHLSAEGESINHHSLPIVRSFRLGRSFARDWDSFSHLQHHLFNIMLWLLRHVPPLLNQTTPFFQGHGSCNNYIVILHHRINIYLHL